jgi:zinc protease
VLKIEFQRHVLSNGLTVVLAPDRSVPVVAVNLWYGVGSRNERPGRTGFAHLFEHMMFQGSAHVPKNKHFELVERAGGSLNATTWFDRTNYFQTLPSHHLDLALWLESDRMGWLLPAMTPDKLENQRDVVRNERRQRYDNQPYGDWDERLQRMVFPDDHPYQHTVIGSMEDLAEASMDDVAEFFETFYVPNNAVLTLTGDFEAEEGLDRVDAWFGEIPRGEVIPPVPGRLEPGAVIGDTVRDEVQARVPLPRVYMASRIPPFTEAAFYAADVATAVLADGDASRLYRRLVREEKLAKDVVSFAFPLITGRSFMTSWVTGYPDSDPTELESALVRELEGLADASDREVRRAVALAETRFLRRVEQLASRADLLSMYQQLFNDPGRVNDEVDRLRAVTAQDVREFAGTTLGPDNRAILTYLPEEFSG